MVIANSYVNPVDIDYRRLPRDFVLFRSGSFSAEESYLLGDRVDAWFVDLRKTPLEAIQREMSRRQYEVGAVIADGQWDRPLWRDVVNSATPQTLIDWCQVMSAVPELAHFYMGQSRPSLTMTMVGCALAVGFCDIIVLDSRFRHSGSGRPFVSMPDWEAVQVAAGVDWRRQVGLDVALLEAALRVFPEATVSDATAPWSMQRFLPRTPMAPEGDHFVPSGKGSGREGALFKEIIASGKARRCAYVTTCDSVDYLWGVKALAASLAQQTDVPLVLVAPPQFEVDVGEFVHGNVSVLRMPSVANPRLRPHQQQRFVNTYSKLSVFGISFLDRAVYVDADALVLRNIDHLFELDGFWAAPDIGYRLVTDVFNSGVFAFDPDADTLQRMLKAVPRTESYDGGDQGFLNEFIEGVNWLPREMNTLRRIENRYPDMFDPSRVAVLHFVGEKPWDFDTDPEWHRLDDLWFQHLPNRDKVAFLGWIKRQAAEQRSTGVSVRVEVLMDEAAALARQGRLGDARRRVRAVQAIDPAFFDGRPLPRWTSGWGRFIPGSGIVMARRLGVLEKPWEEAHGEVSA